MRTASLLVSKKLTKRWKAGALSLGLIGLLAVGAASPTQTAAQGAVGDFATVAEDAPWQYDPGVLAGFSVPAGDQVMVRDGPVDGAYFVAWGEDRGWIDGDLLVFEGESGTDDGASDANDDDADDTDPAGDDNEADAGDEFEVQVPSVEALSGLTARIANNDDGADLLDGPSYDAELIDELPVDTVVALRIDELDSVADPDGDTRWWPVRVDDEDGWVAGFFLAPVDGVAVDVPNGADNDTPPSDADAGDEPSDDADDEPSADADDTDADSAPEPDEADAADDADAIVDPSLSELVPGEFDPGDEAAAQTDDGTDVNIREQPTTSGALLGLILNGAAVEVIDGPFFDDGGTDWYRVSDGAVTGFASGTWLVPADEIGPVPATEPNAQPRSPLTPGGAAGAFITPVGGELTQAFGCSPYWFEPFDAAQGCNFHNGIDLAAPTFTPIAAADGGIVTAAGFSDGGLGYYVSIDHGNGFATTYGHMVDQPPVVGGQAVGQGDVIGFVGSTGNSTGPHLHFVVNQNGIDVDPLGFL